MAFEQPTFETPDAADQESAPEAAQRNVIEFPSPPTPETEAQEKEAVLQRLRGEILQFPSTSPEAVPQAEQQDNESQAPLHVVESFEQYKPCEACHGSGRRRWFFTCPVCKGLGSVVASSSQREGYI